eukprot:11909238-Prorocentrum_lima.AAC.1
MTSSLVGSEMCIRDRLTLLNGVRKRDHPAVSRVLEQPFSRAVPLTLPALPVLLRGCPAVP